MRVSFHSAAREELWESVEFYEERVTALGTDFLNAIEFALNKVLSNPLRFRADAVGVRICPVRRFPFTIRYLHDFDIIWVVAIAHTKKRPDYWRARLKRPIPDGGSAL